MRIPNPLSAYFNERIEVLTTHLNNTRVRLNEEDLHRLRVEIKKMNTLLRLLEVVARDGYEKKKYEKVLLKMFGPGGKLRESQQNIAQATAFGMKDIGHYRDHLATKNKKQEEKLQAALQQFVTARLDLFRAELENFITHIDQDELNASITRFLNYEFRTIQDLSGEMSDQKTLHNIRRHLKAAGYMLILAIELWNDDKLIPFSNEVKSAETLIGNWHDKVVFVKSLGKYAEQDLSPAQVHVLNDTAQKANREIEVAYHEIESVLTRLINKDIDWFKRTYPA